MTMQDRLREKLKLKYVGNCKCGQCQLVEADLIEEAAAHIDALEARAAPRVKALEDAIKTAIALRFDTYRAGNGRQIGIEGDDGEKCWIIPNDAMHGLESVLEAAEDTPPRVRRLLWTQRIDDHKSGPYSVGMTYGQGPKDFMVTFGSTIIGWRDTVEEGKALAQSHHEAYVLSALEPS